MSEAAGDALRVITPAARPALRFPRWTAPLVAFPVVVSLATQSCESSAAGWSLAVALTGACFAGAGLASWLEQRLGRLLQRLPGALRLAAAVVLPPGVLIAGLVATGLSEDVLEEIGIEGVAISVGLIGTLWLVGATIGSLAIILIDVAVSAVVKSFRHRIILAVLALVLLVTLLMLSLAQMANVIVEGMIENPSEVMVDLGAGVNLGPQIASYIAENRADAVAFFLLLMALIALPAVTSAAGHLADAVMERIHPLTYALDEVAHGARDVRLEEGGSSDFIEVSRHFNHMVQELQLAERMERAFGTYVSAQVLEKIKAQHGEAAIPASLRHATVLFADIRGFTTLSEKLPPERVVDLLNRYFDRIVDVISSHEGYLDKFIGDAVVVVFNGPIDQPDHGERAVRCACSMIAAVEEMNEAGAFPEVGRIDLGIGVASGPMVCGNIGSAKQMEYTVIGDTVNLAARIEGMTKLYGTRVIISSATWELVEDQAREVRRLARVVAKGKKKSVMLIEVLDPLPTPMREAKLTTRACFETALEAFETGEMSAALAGYEAVLAQSPDDKAAQLGVEHARSYLDDGLPEAWDGAVRLESK